MCTNMYVVCAHVCARDEKGIMGVLLHHSPSYSQEIGSLTEPGATLAASNLVSTGVPTWLGHRFMHPGQALTLAGCSSSLSRLPSPKILLWFPASLKSNGRGGVCVHLSPRGKSATNLHYVPAFNRGKLSHRQQRFT